MTYFNKYGIADRFDNADTIYVKRMLQHVLPEEVRNNITSNLFNEYVGVSESDFAKTLYMNIDEVIELVNCGMYVGSHGCMHYWLDRINENEQRIEISKSLQFLEEVKAPTKNWIMCYPYGSYNRDTLGILKDRKCAVGLTTKVGIAKISQVYELELPRYDTNDFPQ